MLPVVALSLPHIAYISRLTRGSMIEVLRTNYVRTARAKGIRRSVMSGGTLSAARMLPVIAYLGPATAITVTGSVVIEQIFGIPGIGRYFVRGRDQPRLSAGDGRHHPLWRHRHPGQHHHRRVRGMLDPKVSYE